MQMTRRSSRTSNVPCTNVYPSQNFVKLIHDFLTETRRQANKGRDVTWNGQHNSVARLLEPSRHQWRRSVENTGVQKACTGTGKGGPLPPRRLGGNTPGKTFWSKCCIVVSCNSLEMMHDSWCDSDKVQTSRREQSRSSCYTCSVVRPTSSGNWSKFSHVTLHVLKIFLLILKLKLEKNGWSYRRTTANCC